MTGPESVAASGTRKTDAWPASGLAFVGGYGDAASFVLAKTFTGHVTGNLVLVRRARLLGQAEVATDISA
jgi:uncharacterized membrane protein YoaK (UPF0700 family)